MFESAASVSNLDQDMAEVRRSKYDSKSVQEAKQWLGLVLEADLGPEDLMDILKDGTVLCSLVNKVNPSINLRPKASRMPFVQMENISMFLKAASNMGLPQYDLFQTVDLYEGKDPAQVLQTLYSFSRQANQMNSEIPTLGPKLGQKRQTPVRPTKPGVGIPAWNTAQYGYMGGASQGTEKVVFSKRRDIINKP
ncbi:calponin homology domain-containing protein [Lipomyces oligophaga]|uniref:calponin homology domain-containing protein n=1 Tax=Lipomyces oligophaga TaxID=45792 RepID=UPI0034CF5D31